MKKILALATFCALGSSVALADEVAVKFSCRAKAVHNEITFLYHLTGRGMLDTATDAITVRDNRLDFDVRSRPTQQEGAEPTVLLENVSVVRAAQEGSVLRYMVPDASWGIDLGLDLTEKTFMIDHNLGSVVVSDEGRCRFRRVEN